MYFGCTSRDEGLKGMGMHQGVLVLQGRLFDFGNNKVRDQPVNVAVASGVPCGVAARRGDVSQLALHIL